MEPEHWSRDFAETKRAEIFRGAIVRTPIPRWNRRRTAIAGKDLLPLTIPQRKSSILGRSTGLGGGAWETFPETKPYLERLP